MSTVGGVIDRMRREWIDTPAQTSSFTRLTADVAFSYNDTDIHFDTALLMPEELELLGVGTVIEVGRELMVVSGVNTAADGLVRAIRGTRGTEPTAHTADTMVYLSPRWSRQAMFDAVCDGVVELYPDLFGVATEFVLGNDWQVELSDPRAKEIIECRMQSGNRLVHLDEGELITDYEAFPSGVAVQFTHWVPYGDVWIRYRHSFDRPTSDNDDLTAAGIDPSWEEIIVMKALRQLLIQPGADRATVEFITRALQEQLASQGSDITDIGLLVFQVTQPLIDAAQSRLRRVARMRMVTHHVGIW